MGAQSTESFNVSDDGMLRPVVNVDDGTEGWTGVVRVERRCLAAIVLSFCSKDLGVQGRPTWPFIPDCCAVPPTPTTPVYDRTTPVLLLSHFREALLTSAGALRIEYPSAYGAGCGARQCRQARKVPTTTAKTRPPTRHADTASRRRAPKSFSLFSPTTIRLPQAQANGCPDAKIVAG